jgi:fused signal recognition particle receptor
VRFLEGIKKGLAKTRQELLGRIERTIKGRELDEEALEEIEEALILSDCGPETVQRIMGRIRERWKRGGLNREGEIKEVLREEIEEILSKVDGPLRTDTFRPFVILTVGVNGVGKTTTVAKLAFRLLKEGRSVLLGACDTFRAAAREQLEVIARRLGVPLVKQKEGSDPAAVAFDAWKACLARQMDVLILDTAGRLHTRANLMEEMKKIKRVLAKEGGGPHEVLLVLDATQGQNAIVQARTFHEALGVTGLVVSKLDGTAKGGFLLPIASSLGIPVRFLGVGEGLEDLIPFESSAFSRALLSVDEEG